MCDICATSVGNCWCPLRTGDLATWRPGDLATCWRPVVASGCQCGSVVPHHLAGNHWRPLATWRLATTGNLATYWRLSLATWRNRALPVAALRPVPLVQVIFKITIKHIYRDRDLGAFSSDDLGPKFRRAQHRLLPSVHKG